MTTRPLALAAFVSVLCVSSVSSADEPATSASSPASTVAPAASVTPSAPVVSAAPAPYEAPVVEEGVEPVPVAPAAPASRVETSSEERVDEADGATADPSGRTVIRTQRGARYGLEILLADGLALAVAGASIKFEQPGFALAGLGTYLIAPPVVHAIHGQGGRAAASFGLRVGAPAVGMLTGMAIAGAFDGSGGGAYRAIAGGVVGLGAGAIAAMVVDAVVLAREPDVKVRVPRGWDGKPRLAPTVSALPGGGAVGVGGSF